MPEVRKGKTLAVGRALIRANIGVLGDGNVTTAQKILINNAKKWFFKMV